MKEKYLPIGSVVLLKDAQKRLMITGYCIKDTNNNKLYDYCGCIYPEGNIDPNKIALFNHDQIVNISFVGLIDSEQIEFMKNLKVIINKEQKEDAA